MYMHLLGILFNDNIHLSECTGQSVAIIKITGKKPVLERAAYVLLINLSSG